MYYAIMLQKGSLLNRGSYHVIRVRHVYCLLIVSALFSVCALKRDELLVRRDGVVCEYEN